MEALQAQLGKEALVRHGGAHLLLAPPSLPRSRSLRLGTLGSLFSVDHLDFCLLIKEPISPITSIEGSGSQQRRLHLPR